MTIRTNGLKNVFCMTIFKFNWEYFTMNYNVIISKFK